MRGEPILVNENVGKPSSSSEVNGLDWEYAMQWSNGTLDLFSMLIPGVVGGGSGEKISPSSASAKDLKQKGANVKNAPLYWGSLPFTSGPNYMGAIICFLFILGLILVKGPIKWWLGIAVFIYDFTIDG